MQPGREGGTWLACHKDGRIAMLTNIFTGGVLNKVGYKFSHLNLYCKRNGCVFQVRLNKDYIEESRWVTALHGLVIRFSKTKKRDRVLVFKSLIENTG